MPAAGSGVISDESRYRLLVEAVADYAIYMLDPQGYIASWNPGAERFKGYTATEIIGQNFSRFYTDEDQRAGLPQKYLEIAARDGRLEREGWRVRKDGSKFWAHVVIDPIRDSSGSLIGFAKVTRDFTERKAADDALRKSEEQFRLLVEGVADYAIFMLDPEGRVSSWNLGAQRIKGYAPHEIIGQHISRFYTEEDRSSGEPDISLATARAEGRFEKEGWRVRKDGSRFFAHAVIDAIRDDDDRLIGFAKITRDITERMEAQAALERTREALFQAQKMEAVGQLTGGIAHDFNNLLMAILGSLEIAQSRLDADPRISPFLDNAVAAARRGASLTQRMLAFARKQQLDLQSVDLPALVAGMMELLKGALDSTIAIKADFPPRMSPVRADPHQLEAALLNLVVNARDAMPGGGSIVVTAQAVEVNADDLCNLEPGSYVCLSVEDTGEGMDAATLARATEPFFTTKGVGKGTGLGLSMIHGLAEQLRGRLLLESRPGAGTKVTLCLPALPTQQEQPRPAQAPPADEDRKPAATNLTVLAVDDDALVLMNTAAMLEDLGHVVVEALSGPAALEALRKNEAIDLVITDHAMPKMTGTQLAEAVRQERPDVPVILATGYAELPPGGDRSLPYLSKPFGARQLADAIAKVFKG